MLTSLEHRELSAVDVEGVADMLDVERRTGGVMRDRLCESCFYHLTTPFCQTSRRSRIRKQQRDGAGAEQRHHDQRRIHVGIGRPTLRPLQVPAEPGLDADHLGDDEHGKG